MFRTDQIIESMCVILGAGIFMAVFYSLCNSKLKHVVARQNNRIRTIIGVAKSIFTTVLVIIVILWIFSIFGFQVKSFVAGLGLVSAVVGLALQDTIKDVLMGLHIISDDSLDIGDFIRIGAYEGRVEEFDLRTTVISDINTGNLVYLCNREIVAVERLASFFGLDIVLNADTDMEQAFSICSNVAAAISELETVENCEFKGIQSINSDGVDYKLVIHCSPADKFDVMRSANASVKSALEDAGISPADGRIRIVSE